MKPTFRSVKAKIVACIVAFLLISGAALAYNEGGHFYTVSIATQRLLTSSKLPALSTEKAALISFCAQLPDESYELDAVEVYWALASKNKADYFRWLFGNTSPVAVRRMITVQQLLHGLAGGRTTIVRGIARTIVQDLAREALADPPQANAFCALGFAMHLYGDSFAHTKLYAPDVMYPTGRGHAADFHYPDYPLYELSNSLSRENGWKDYVIAMPTLFDGTFAFDGLVLQRVVPTVFALARKASQLSEYGEGEIINIILDNITSKPSLNPAVEGHDHDFCQEYVNHSFPGGSLKILTAPNCQQSWNLFRRKAEVRFNVDGARDPIVEYVDPLFVVTK